VDLGRRRRLLRGGRASYFESESEAFDHLEDIAESYNTTVEPDSGSFSMSEPSNYISYQEYYIEELNRP